MPQFVSKNHKEMLRRLREIFVLEEVIGWPDPEVNLGHLCGLAEANLRADAFILFSRGDRHKAVAVEWQSEIHTKEGADKSEWFDYDDIAGRDNLKKQLCAKAGVALVELWTLDMTDMQLYDMVVNAGKTSHLTQTAIDALLNKDKESTFGKPDKTFVKSDQGFAPPRDGFVSGGSIGTGEKTPWPKQKMSGGKFSK